jgi:methylated-DNA-protein-cysteine methyltransferase-like protein
LKKDRLAAAWRGGLVATSYFDAPQALDKNGQNRFLSTRQMPRSARKTNAWKEVYTIVRRIPRGRVMNYGQIAQLLNRPLSARAVGWAMRQCPDGLPWHRVVNASGGCSTDHLPDHPPGLQRALLEAEGVRFRRDNTLDLSRYRWSPRKRVH